MNSFGSESLSGFFDELVAFLASLFQDIYTSFKAYYSSKMYQSAGLECFWVSRNSAVPQGLGTILNNFSNAIVVPMSSSTTLIFLWKLLNWSIWSAFEYETMSCPKSLKTFYYVRFPTYINNFQRTIFICEY